MGEVLDPCNKAKLTEAIKDIWKGDYSSWRDVTVNIVYYTKMPLTESVEVRIEQMYEHLPLGLKHLVALAKLFDTDRFTVNQESHSGCETCDYGSSYSHNFTVKMSDVGQWDAVGIKS